MEDEFPRDELAFRTIETLNDNLRRDFEIIGEVNKNTAARLVWFVAIAGFALLNVSSLANNLIEPDLTSSQQFILVLPWSISALLGILAHWLLGEVTSRDSIYYMVKRHAIRSFLATAPPRPTVQQVLNIIDIDETDQEIAKKKEAVDRLNPWSVWAERLTFVFLMFSFVWSILFPFIIWLNC